MDFKNFRLLVFILLISGTAFSQNSKNFTYSFSGDTTYASNIKYVSRFFSNNYFKINDKRALGKDIKFYKKGGIFFGNFKRFSMFNKTNFAKREVEGAVNIFRNETLISPTYLQPGFNNGMMHPGGIKTRYFYNVGEFGDLKRLKYKSLRVDLNGNEDSMLQLKKFKRVRRRETLLYIVGGSIFAAGVATFIDDTNNTPDGVTPKVGRGFLIIGAGVGTLITNYIISSNKRDHLMDAIDIFNE
jgi:hypothetical protein